MAEPYKNSTALLTIAIQYGPTSKIYTEFSIHSMRYHAPPDHASLAFQDHTINDPVINVTFQFSLDMYLVMPEKKNCSYLSLSTSRIL